jgi:hypothetical protein
MNFKIEKENGFDCPCPMKKCPNHGNCEDCKQHCVERNKEPFCEREHGLLTRIFFRKSYKMVQKMKAEGILP